MPFREVVIVDDEEAFVEALTLGFTAAGIKVRSADNNLEMHVAGDPEADFVILNPFISGRDGMLWLKELAELTSPPNIVLVGSEPSDVLNAAGAVATSRGLEVAAVLRKPVTPDDILSAIQSAGNRPHPAVAILPPDCDIKIIEAIHHDSLQLYFQPKIGMGDFAFAGAEALLSGDVPGVGFVAPSYIVEVAKRDLVTANRLSAFTLNKGLEAFQSWTAEGLAGPVSVNIPLASLESDGFVELVSDLVAGRGLEPQNLIIELCESDLYETSPCGLQNLIKLRMRGVGIALDDFGKKYSGIARLGELPLTEVKIDICIVKLARWSQLARGLIRHVIDLCGSSGISVTVEGVERLKDLGAIPRRCGISIQGHIAVPKLALDELLVMAHEIPNTMNRLAAAGAERAAR